ncbi:MAG: 50S ribosomal protein L18 [Candidatus Sungiibacteriota bacterium]|uniref:Large ribosomal subunit protein uL18 n=1 Tax=Candidatus Sungiibacteriota bacterium TaxID=2750080 RepID=A0A7T5RJ06_9BACT|nr:MAG: 50S ribosomal protein L18 [Candidatus Sungbacteria bacterium]
MKTRKDKRTQRHRRVRARIKGTDERPRLSAFKSNRHLMLQLIDDIVGKTLVAANDTEVSIKKTKGSLLVRAGKVGELLAKRALEKKIKQAVFDRGGYKYHGIVKAASDGARKGGLTF